MLDNSEKREDLDTEVEFVMPRSEECNVSSPTGFHMCRRFVHTDVENHVSVWYAYDKVIHEHRYQHLTWIESETNA